MDSYGSAVYHGTVARGHHSFSVAIEIDKSIGETQSRTATFITTMQQGGFVQQVNKPDYW